MFRRRARDEDESSEMVAELLELSFGRTWDEATAKRFRADVERARAEGMRAKVFGKVGDSNLGAYNALFGLGCRKPKWDRYDRLAPTMRRYRKVKLPPGREIPRQVVAPADRRPWNSFSRCSEAARSGIIADQLLQPSNAVTPRLNWVADPECGPEESTLEFEVRLIKPEFAFIHLGTNGDGYGMTAAQTAEQVRLMIGEVRKLGPAPVVCTIPPQLDDEGHEGRWDFAREVSAGIAAIAQDEGVPLFDQWQALADDRLVEHGMITFDGDYYDGFHLETYGGFRSADALDKSVDFRPEALRYGTNLRNLLFLHILRSFDEALGR